jgi:hypothetical protein
MNHYPELVFRKAASVVRGTRSESRNKIIRTIMMAAIVGTVALGLIAESRLMPEQLLELSKASYVGP